MNFTAATMTAATVTVYFVGLIHFQTNGASGPVDVIVPLATATGEVHETTTLDPHVTSIAVAGYSSCPGTVVPATASDAMPAMPETCRVADLSGKTIELPTTTDTPALTTTTGNFGLIPHLGALCPDIGRAVRGEFIATRLQLTKGTLTAVAPHDGAAWWAKLEIPNASNTLKVGSKSVPLSGDATIWILSQPSATAPVLDEKKHFFWNYKILQNRDCAVMPNIPTMATVPAYGTGVGCSNTQYP